MIEFEEGAVCYAVGHQWKEGDILPSDNGSAVKAHLPTFLKSSDFKLNEPREGWYIPKSELDTEEKYNKAVEVFGLFNYIRKAGHMQTKESFDNWGEFITLEDGEAYVSDSIKKSHLKKIKCTFDQLMTIGELKLKMLEREKSAPEITPDLTPDLTPDNRRRNKSKQAYYILNGLDYEYDLIKQQWFKKHYI
mgnify:CR=1 FL=1